MTGSSHKAIGIACGAAYVIHSVKANGGIDPSALLVMATTPIGALMPDVDHKGSTYGKKVDKVKGTVNHIARIGVLCIAAFTAYVAIMGNIGLAVFVGLTLLTMSLVLMIFGRIGNSMNSNNFFTKHRGIMHTLFVPCVLTVLSWFMGEEAIVAVILGFNIGYISHLFADMLTKAGCPVLWPIATVPIRILKIRTGTTAETVAAAVLIGGVILCSIIL